MPDKSIKKSEAELAAEAIVNSNIIETRPPPAMLELAGLNLDWDKLDAREKAGIALIGKTIGIAIAANLNMREQIETASKILVDEIIKRQPLPDDEDPLRLLELKIKAGTGLAVMVSKHTELTRELTQMAVVKAHTDKQQINKRVAPQVFLGTNYVQNNVQANEVDKPEYLKDNK